MTDPTTTNLVMAQPTRGSDGGTWDTPVNGNTGILDAVAGGVTTKSLSVSNVTLSTSESQVNIIRLTGSLGTSVQITLGAIIKAWIIDNRTTGNQSQYIRIAGSTGTGNTICAPPGTSHVYWDGTNMGFVNLPHPVGGYWDHAGSGVPPWVSNCTIPPYLLCDGSSYNSSTYPQLFDFLQSVSLPDARARMRIALDGGTGRVTSAGSGVDGLTRFASGGAQNQTISLANLPSYTLPNSLGVAGGVSLSGAASGVINNQSVGGGANLTGGGGAYTIGPITATPSLSVSGAVTSGGSGTALVTMPPTYVGGVTMIRAA